MQKEKFVVIWQLQIRLVKRTEANFDYNIFGHSFLLV